MSPPETEKEKAKSRSPVPIPAKKAPVQVIFVIIHLYKYEGFHSFKYHVSSVQDKSRIHWNGVKLKFELRKGVNKNMVVVQTQLCTLDQPLSLSISIKMCYYS